MAPVDLKACGLAAQDTKSEEDSSPRNLTKIQSMLLISPANNFESNIANSNKETSDFERNLTTSSGSDINNSEQVQLTLNSEHSTVNEYVSSSSVSTSSLSPLSDVNNSSNW